MERMEFIKRHYYRKRTQACEYKAQIAELGVGEAVVHVDYSENYKNQQQNEIKVLSVLFSKLTLIHI